MFTGLVADVGLVAALSRSEEGAVLSIRTSLAEEIGLGDSIAVDGVCLTATAVDADSFSVQAMNETLARSALGRLEAGSRVNLELALRAGDRLGGHFVQGHVDGVGTVRELREDGFSTVVAIDSPESVARYVVEKGSIAVDGVSLTVSAVTDEGFEVSLIPETLARTTLGVLAAGDIVNLEADVIAKHVERLMEARLS